MKKLTNDQKAWIVGALLFLSGLAAMLLAAAGGLLVAAVCFIPLTAAHGALVVGRFRECWREPEEWKPVPRFNPWGITEVRYRRLRTFGNYENEAIEVASEVASDQHPDEVLSELRKYVDSRLKVREELDQRLAEVESLDQQIANQRHTLNAATERAEKAKAFLKGHGLELYGDLPF